MFNRNIICMNKLLLVLTFLWLVCPEVYARFQVKGRLRLIRPVEIVVEDLNGKEIVRCSVVNGQEFKSKQQDIGLDLYKVKVGEFEEWVLLDNEPLTFSGFFNENNPDESSMKMDGIKFDQHFRQTRAEFATLRPKAAAMLETFGKQSRLEDMLIALSVVHLHTGILDMRYEPFRTLIDATPESIRGSIVYQKVKELTDRYSEFGIGNPAYNFSACDVNGKVYSLTDFKGKIILLDFWASWCGPCRKEMKSLHKIYEEMKGDDLQFISLSLDGERDEWIKAMDADKIPWLSLWERYDGENPKDAFRESRIKPHYGFFAIPFIVLIDKDGRTRKRFLRGEDVRSAIEELRISYK